MVPPSFIICVTVWIAWSWCVSQIIYLLNRCRRTNGNRAISFVVSTSTTITHHQRHISWCSQNIKLFAKGLHLCCQRCNRIDFMNPGHFLSLTTVHGHVFNKLVDGLWSFVPLEFHPWWHRWVVLCLTSSHYKICELSSIRGKLCCEHLLTKSLNLSQVSNNNFELACTYDDISFWIFFIFPGGKYLVRKASTSSSQVLIEPRGKHWSHCLVWPLSENRKALCQITSSETPLIFNILYTSKKFLM